MLWWKWPQRGIDVRSSSSSTFPKREVLVSFTSQPTACPPAGSPHLLRHPPKTIGLPPNSTAARASLTYSAPPPPHPAIAAHGATQGVAWGSTQVVERSLKLPHPPGLQNCKLWHVPPRHLRFEETAAHWPIFAVVRDPVERAISEARFRGVACTNRTLR